MPTKSFGVKLKNFLKTNYKFLIFCAFFFFLNCTFLAIASHQNGFSLLSKRSVLIIIGMIAIHIILCLFILFAKKRQWPIQKIFLIVGSCLGLMYLFAIPIGRVPDESTHLWKVYSVAQGNFLTETATDGATGNYLPENIATISNNYNKNAYKELSGRITEPISDNQVFTKTLGTNPVDYLPQIIGMEAGRIFHLPMLVTLYLSRLFGLIVCIVIIYLCLKYIPILKKPLFFLACLPMTMQLFVGITYDGIIFCSAVALVSAVLYFIHNQNAKLKISHYFMLVLLCIFIVATKPVYFPICALLFFIPAKCFESKKRKYISITIILMLTIMVFLSWASFSTVSEPGNGANTGDQIHFILSNPIKYLGILTNNILDMPINYLNKIGQLEWLDLKTNEFYLFSTLIIFIILCAEERLNPSLKSTKKFRWFTLATSAASTVLIFTALYIQWSHVGGGLIEGVQTRYFLPILITIPMICIPTACDDTHSSQKYLIPEIYLYAFVVFLNLNALGAIIYAHS